MLSLSIVPKLTTVTTGAAEAGKTSDANPNAVAVNKKSFLGMLFPNKIIAAGHGTYGAC